MSVAADGLGEAVADALGSRVVSRQPVPGGDIDQAERVELADGRTTFVKHPRRNGPRGTGRYLAESHGLLWLAGASQLRVPEVLAVADDDETLTPFLALAWIEPAPPAVDHDDQLGRGLAALHRTGTTQFGLDRDNVLATLPQRNDPCPTWAEFYATRRLEPLARRAVDVGRLPTSFLADLDRLAGRLDELVGPPEPPARLHGDLWSGNVVIGPRGRPWLVDPAVYGGHREVDLAMMRLFGGFGPRCFAAYEEAFPLADGHEERVALYQLYPLLAHAVLFGGTYGQAVQRTMVRYS